MRLWSIHPGYLDAKGLVALWREGLLAQKVLKGETRGYRNHPQLNRFKATGDPVAAIASYLKGVLIEAKNRGYHFDGSKLSNEAFPGKLEVSNGQLDYEFKHLLNKLEKRDPLRYRQLKGLKELEPHSLFIVIDGDIATWEIVE
ncbi:MAG: pyrimidine dimer DNA glycosylase/endonuclease V [Candidatus Marinimicrobia bacterium]|nr:pyrimidine dimer DNA glycosylase/endonuclease V [Candidatus Neomarinimicrobiota bacterium]